MKLLSRAEEFILLAVWRLEGNAYTLSVLDQLSRTTGYRWQVGSVYVPLEKLARKGYLEKYPGGPTAERGGRRKSLYRLTQRGREALKGIREVHESAWCGVSKTALD